MRRTFALLGLVLGLLAIGLATAGAASATDLKWSASDPAPNNGSYLPTYAKVTPAQQSCPAPTGSTGRAADPLQDAVAFASPATSSNFDAVSSLAPKHMALGQIVPFEVVVDGATAASNPVVIDPYWLTKTTNGGDFGFDPAYGVLCAFVDTADAGTTDPGADAKVSAFSSATSKVGTSNEQIDGSISVTGLQSGDRVIVEIWVVLKATIPAGTTGNVQTGLTSATQGSPATTVNTGNQTVPLLRSQDFFSASADVSVTKTDAPDPATQGETLTYTLLAKNNSTDTVANGVVVTDTLDPNTTFVSASGASCTASNGIVTCNVGFITPGATATITIVTTVSPTAPTANDPTQDPEAGNQGTTCTTTPRDLCNRVTHAATTGDPNTANNAYSQPTNVLASAAPVPGIKLTKTVTETGFASAGVTLHYTLVAENIGQTTLTDVTISDPLLGALSCTPAQPTTLAVGAKLTCTGTYVTTQDDIDAGKRDNTATVAGTPPTGPPVTAKDTATVPSTATASVSLTKVADRSFFGAAGVPITYTLVATNTGDQTLSNVTITDPLLTGTITCDRAAPVTLTPGAKLTCTGTHTTTDADVALGRVDNTAIAMGTKPGGGTVNDQASVSVPFRPAGLTLKKTVAQASFGGPGEQLDYTLVATNTGQTTLTLVSISDPKLGALTCTPAQPTSLAPGAKLTCTGSSTTTAADVAAGKVPNTATATGKAPDITTPLSAQDSALVPYVAPAPERADLSIVKTASPARVTAGGTLTYTLTVHNDGPDAAHGVTVVDPLPAHVTFVSASPGCAFAGGTVTCDVGTIAAGDTATRTIVVKVDAGFTGSKTDTTHDLLIQKVESFESIAGGQTADLSLSCPSNAVMVDANPSVDSVDQGAGGIDKVRILESRSDPASPNRFLFRVKNGTTGQAQVHLFGVCMEKTTTSANGTSHTLSFSDVLTSAPVVQGAGRHDQSLTCPVGTVAVAPGYKFSGAAGDLVRSETSADLRTWSFGYVLDGPATVQVSVRCLATKTSTDGGAFGSLEFLHVDRKVVVPPSDLTTGQPYVIERVSCPVGYKGIVATFDLPEGVRQIGTKPQPINRDFVLLNTSGRPVEVYLDLLCVRVAVRDYTGDGEITNRATVSGDEDDPDPADNASSVTSSVDPAAVRAAAPATSTATSPPAGTTTTPAKTVARSGLALVATTVVSGKRAAFRVRCAAGGPSCIGTLVVRSTAGKRLASVRYRIRAGRTATIKVGAKALKRLRKAVVTVTGQDGRKTSRSVKLRLR